MKLLYRGLDEAVFDRIIYILEKEKIYCECHRTITHSGKVTSKHAGWLSPEEVIIDKSDIPVKVDFRIYVKRKQYEQARTFLGVL